MTLEHEKKTHRYSSSAPRELPHEPEQVDEHRQAPLSIENSASRSPTAERQTFVDHSSPKKTESTASPPIKKHKGARSTSPNSRESSPPPTDQDQARILAVRRRRKAATADAKD
eukprot:Polyplicarium_translucidae@DN4427_c0_g1_i1.p1